MKKCFHDDHGRLILVDAAVSSGGAMHVSAQLLVHEGSVLKAIPLKDGFVPSNPKLVGMHEIEPLARKAACCPLNSKWGIGGAPTAGVLLEDVCNLRNMLASVSDGGPVALEHLGLLEEPIRALHRELTNILSCRRGGVDAA